MHPFIEEIYQSRCVRDSEGNTYPLHSEVDQSEGGLLENLIAGDPSVRTTLEVGCAYGLSSLHMCSALAERHNPRHVIIDPFQATEWRGIGVSNLKRAGFHFFELIKERSEFALPQLAQREPEAFDLVFIDGWHTFDHTLLDLFYANRLVRQNGYIVIDDCKLPGVAQAVAYFSVYPAYRIVEAAAEETAMSSIRSAARKILRAVMPPPIAGYLIPKSLYDKLYRPGLFPSMVVLRKVGEDCRSWNWYVSC